MLPLIERDTRSALSWQGILEGGNEEIWEKNNGSVPRKFHTASVFNNIQICLATNLAMTLARLYDEGSKRYRLEQKDVASIPLIIEDLSLSEIQDYFVVQARSWTPDLDGLEAIHEAGTIEDVEYVIDAWIGFRSSDNGKRVLEVLTRFRDNFLSHSLTKSVENVLPTYNDVFALSAFAIDVVPRIKMLMSGHNWNAAERLRIEQQLARQFWGPMLDANMV